MHMGEDGGLGVKPYSHGLNFVVIIHDGEIFGISYCSRGIQCTRVLAQATFAQLTGKFSAVEVACHFTGSLLMVTCYGSCVI